jgi:hypothetical protein
MERAMKSLIPLGFLFLPLLAVPALAQAPATMPAASGGPSQAVAVHPSETMAMPSGEGDAFAITCRPPQNLPGSRLKGPEVCKTNQVWAQYRADGMEPAADGIHDVPAERWRTTNPQACHSASPGGGGTANMVYTNFSQMCE